MLKEATERFRIALQNTLDKLDVWVEQKGYKRERKKQKLEERALDRQYKAAKKEYAKNSRCK